MKVFVVESTRYIPEEREVSKRITDDVCVSILNYEYVKYTNVIGVFATANEASDFIKKERKKIITKYGEKALYYPYDTEEEGELYAHYTFGTTVWRVKEGDPDA